jgi:hypothetical protein
MSRIYYRGAKAAIVCYGKGRGGSGVFFKQGLSDQPQRTFPDPWLCLLHVHYQDLTDSSSFERAKFWVKELRSLEEVGGPTLLKDQELWLCCFKEVPPALSSPHPRAVKSTCVVPRVICWRKTGGVDVWTSMTSRTMQTVALPQPLGGWDGWLIGWITGNRG